MKLFTIAILGALALAPVSANAQDKPSADDTGKKSYSTGDGNRMICRTSTVPGSRLKAGRVCMTAAEWAESKRVTRQTVEQAQQMRPSAGN